jgi:glycerate kinase
MGDRVYNQVTLHAEARPNGNTGITLNGVVLKDVVGFSMEAVVDDLTKVTFTVIANVNKPLKGK